MVRDPESSMVVAFTHFRYTLDMDLEEGQSVGDDGSSTCVYIFEIQVSKVAKGGGLGRKMMDIVEKFGELEKVSRDIFLSSPAPRNLVVSPLHPPNPSPQLPKATLTVFKMNLNAVRFYVKLGYKVDTDIDPNPGEGEDEGEIGAVSCFLCFLCFPCFPSAPFALPHLPPLPPLSLQPPPTRPRRCLRLLHSIQTSNNHLPRGQVR